MEVFNFILENVDFKEKNFIEAIIFTVICTTFHTLLPYLQFRYKFISKIAGDDMGRAADFLAYLLIHLGTYKNLAFFESLYTNKIIKVPDWYDYSILPVGVAMIIFGVILIIFSFERLGLRGMYFGDHFGFLLNKRIDQFPYNLLDNPQYVGTNLVYLGLSLSFKSLAGIIYTLFVEFLCRICYVPYESKRLNEFYPNYESDGSTASENMKKCD